MIKFFRKFKKWIIGFLLGGTVLAAGLNSQDLYNLQFEKIYTICDKTAPKLTSISDTLKNFKAQNPDNSLRNLTASERANLKSCEMGKRGTEFAGIYDSPQYGVKIEIIGEVKAIEINGQNGIELFARAWKGTQQLGFGKDGSVEIERFRIFNPPILVDDPNGDIIREWTDRETGELKQRKLREDPIEAIRQVISHNVKLVGKDNGKIVIGKIGNTTSTFYPDASPESTSVDGEATRGDVAEGWSTIKAGDGTEANDTGAILPVSYYRTAASSGNFSHFKRNFRLYDTSALGDTDTINSATESLYGQNKLNGNSGNVDVNIYSSTPGSNTAIVAGDLNQVGSTAFSTTISYANWSTTAYNDFALNASGLANISQTGISKFSSRMPTYDVVGTAPTWNVGSEVDALYAYMADQAGTANDPKLVVVHSGAVAGVNKSYIITEE